VLSVDGYVRVSQVGGRSGEGFISPDVQERAIRDWAQRQGVEVLVQPHELNVSGGTMERPIFGRIMERIRSGESGGLVVYKLDRFSRTLLGAVSTLAELGQHDALFASATEPALDYSSPAGRAFMHQMFVFAEFTRSTLKESWATSQRHAIERGIHISPNGYLGYDRGPDGRLVPNADAALVGEIFRSRAGGETWNALASLLADRAPRDDATVWTPQALQRLCSKRVYLGEASRYVEQDRDGRGAIVNPDAHPPLVTVAEWQAAQMKPKVPSTNGSASPPLLSGLVRCAGCRYSLSAGRGPKGERVYRCRRDHASGRCPTPAAVMADALEEHVESMVLAEIEGTARLVPDSSERERGHAELEQARADLDGFKGDRAARRKLGADWHEWLDTYLGAVREAGAKLARIDGRSLAVSEGLTRDHYLALPSTDRREVLAGFIDVVFVRRSRGRGRNVDPIDRRSRVLWRGEGPADLPVRRRVNSIVSFDLEGDVEAGVPAPDDGA